MRTNSSGLWRKCKKLRYLLCDPTSRSLLPLSLYMSKLHACLNLPDFSSPAVLKLPAWFPGMSLKTEMAMARKLTRYYVETAFEYSLQRVVRSTSLSHTSIQYPIQRECILAPSMVHDALQNMEAKGTVPDESWMSALKGATATAFLGTLFYTPV